MSSFTGNAQEGVASSPANSMHPDMQRIGPPPLTRTQSTIYHDDHADADADADIDIDTTMMTPPQMRRTFTPFPWGTQYPMPNDNVDLEPDLDTVSRRILFEDPELDMEVHDMEHPQLVQEEPMPDMEPPFEWNIVNNNIYYNDLLDMVNNVIINNNINGMNNHDMINMLNDMVNNNMINNNMNNDDILDRMNNYLHNNINNLVDNNNINNLMDNNNNINNLMDNMDNNLMQQQ